MENTGRGWKRESLTSLFDTAHVCLFKNSLPCQLGPVSIDEGLVNVIHRNCESVSKCLGVGADGLWDVIHSLFVSIVCVYILAC